MDNLDKGFFCMACITTLQLGLGDVVTDTQLRTHTEFRFIEIDSIYFLSLSPFMWIVLIPCHHQTTWKEPIAFFTHVTFLWLKIVLVVSSPAVKSEQVKGISQGSSSK